ncbi:PstS family phosphate ABC transporter substrate-binding protein [Halospeciosus flavus]|uniref:PstS family phosphate ABC transporter substrate-binding protein n=1 Tax=Halospeciosus flavus TaxID=3032283 RepID=A0ABD5Z550_9EURY|nr:substrate-binding domain-containing protein [Halospeciosus flavus]
MTDKPVSRRTVLAGGAGLAASFAGCISTSKTPPGSGGADTSGGGGGGGGGTTDLLKAGGSSTVYPIANTAASYWNSNPPASDEEYWGPSQYGIDTQKALADYWAGLYGFESGDGGTAPYNVTVGLSHSGTGMEKLLKGQVDIGNSSAPVSAEMPDLSEEELSKYTDHVVGVDAQPIVVSQEVYNAGVTGITAETLKAIYKGDITDWKDVPGYEGESKSIQVVGRAEGSGTDTAFRLNLYGNANEPIPGVDLRKGQNQQVKTVVANSTNAIAYMALAFVTEQTPAISLTFDGKKFVPGKNLADKDYPLSRDLHMYTYEGTSKQEAAYLRMIISDFGQENFVKTSGYAALTDERQKNQLSKLPSTQ